jgi:hypothetical protein
MASGDAVSVDQVDFVHSPCAVAACALTAQSASTAAIKSPMNPPLKNLLFREVIITYSLYEFLSTPPYSST